MVGEPKSTLVTTVAKSTADVAPAATPSEAQDGFGSETAVDAALHFESSIEQFPALGGETGIAFGRIGIRTVSDLLELNPAVVAERLGRTEISTDVVRLWQIHVALMCCIPRLTLEDAQVLTGAGITSPDEIAEINPAALEERIMAFLRSDRGRRFREGGYRLSRRDMSHWTHDARSERSSWSRHRAFDRWRNRSNSRKYRQVETESSRSSTESRSPRVLRSTSRENGSRKERTTKSTRATSSERSRRSSSSRESSESRGERSSRKLRFYLSRSSDVEDAPAIGPKTASRLAKVGVHTVDDLLGSDPIDLSRQLDARHIKAETIKAWQQQATLVCQIPMLRGHDAQILVACDLIQPKDIAKMSPRQLLERITPFCESKEGERVLRSGATPDLAEVTDWIRWAGQHRALEAA